MLAILSFFLLGSVECPSETAVDALTSRFVFTGYDGLEGPQTLNGHGLKYVSRFHLFHIRMSPVLALKNGVKQYPCDL